MDQTHSPLLRTMLAAASEAGARLVEDQRAIAALTVRSKAGPADMFSEADVRAEETISATLAHAFPDYGFLGEESGLEVGRDASHVWVVDPLDGTTNYLFGSPMWAVNIALARDGHVIAGVTHVPRLGETFFAEEGGGAFLNGDRIAISTRATLGEALLGVGIPFATKPLHGQFLAEMERLTPRVTGIRRVGAGAIDMAWVACGRYDAYWEQSVSAWDMAAGAVIVREAGGVVTDTAGGPLDLEGGTMLACTPAIQADLLDALRRV